VVNRLTKPAEVSPSKSALAALFSVVFLDNLGFAIVVPYLFFFQQSIGGSDFTYGVLLASYSLMSFLFTPIVSRLSDRYGRRKILLPALAISSLSYFAFGTAQVLWLLFASRMIAGTTAATVPVAQAYIADITTDKNRLRYLGLLGAAAGTAFILGPPIGGTLSSYFGYGVPSFLASALALINLVSAYFRLPEPLHMGNSGKTKSMLTSLRETLKQRAIVLLLSTYFLFFLAFVFLQSALSPWLQEVFGWTQLETGFVFFLIGGVSVFTQAVLLPQLSKKLSRPTLVVVGVITLSAGFAALGFSLSLPLLIAVTTVIAFGFGGLYVALNTLISLNAPKEAQGGALGSAWALAALAQTIAPVLATTAFAVGLQIGFPGLAFAISAVLAVVTIPLVLSYRKQAKAQTA